MTDDARKFRDEQAEEFREKLTKGKYVPFDGIVRADFREEYSDLFRENLRLASQEIKEGKITAFDENFVCSTCYVGPGTKMIPNPAAIFNPLLKGTMVAEDSAPSDYADQLANILRDSHITSVEMPNTFSCNGITVWSTTQEERDKMMSALPSTVKSFSCKYGEGGFTDKDLQNLTELMNRNPGMDIRLEFSKTNNPTYGPFQDETFKAFAEATKSCHSLKMRDFGYEVHPLFGETRNESMGRRLKQIADSVGEEPVSKMLQDSWTGLVFNRDEAGLSEQKQAEVDDAQPKIGFPARRQSELDVFQAEIHLSARPQPELYKKLPRIISDVPDLHHAEAHRYGKEIPSTISDVPDRIRERLERNRERLQERKRAPKDSESENKESAKLLEKIVLPKGCKKGRSR